MTPEQLQDLSNNLNDLRAAINQIAGASSIMASSLNRTVQGLGQVDPSFRRAASALGESVDRTRQAGNAIQQEQQAAAQIIRRNAQDQENATRGYVASLRTLTNGLTSAATSLQNLSGVANIAGNAATTLGIKMGAAGEKADAFGKFVSGVGNDILRQAEAYNSLRNSLQRLGGAGEQTASSLYAYAKAAGLHQETLNYMLAPMRALGNNIISLGKGAGDAQRAFMEMLQVSDDQRAMFARLGMFQEDLIARQADYVAQQSAAGISIRNMNTDMQSLRKASLDYVRSLYDLSALTGQSIEQEREKQKEAVYERRLMTEMFAKQAEAARLRREADQAEALGTPEGLEEARQKRGEAAALDRQVQAQEKLIRSLSELPKEMRDGIIGAMTTGGIVNEGAEVLARQGVLDDILEITTNLKERAERGEQVDPEMEAQRIMQLIGEGQAQNAEVLKNALLVGGDELARKLGFSIKDIEFARDQLGRDRPAELEAARRRREAAEAPGADRAADTAAALQNLSISLNQAANEATAALSPFIQSFNLVTNTAEGTSSALGKLGEAAVNAVNGLLEFGTGIAGGAANIPERFAGLPTQGGSSTIGRRPPVDQQVTTAPPPPPTTPVQTPVATPTSTAPVETAPTQGPAEAPATTPADTAQVAPSVIATPVPTYAPITVETNLGNRITLNAGAVGKIAGQIKEGKNRDQLRGEIKKLIGNNTNYNQATIDKIIDKVAEVANLPKPTGSAATTIPATATQVAAPATETPVTAPAVGPAEGTTATPVAAPTAPPATAAVTPELTIPTERPVDRPATTATPTTPAQRIPADVPAQDFTPSADLKNWIRSQIRRGVRRDAVRKALIDIGYTAQQADIALTAELGNVPTAQPTANVPATSAKPETGRQGNQGRPNTGAQRPSSTAPAVTAPAGTTTAPTDFDLSTPNVIDTVSTDQRNWLNRENELRERLSDMVRNKKSITRDQANQILDYYDSIKDKGSIPTVDQIIQNSGALRKPTTTGTRPTGLAESKPEVAPTTQGRIRKPREVRQSSEIANRAGYLPTESGNINTNLEELMAAGLDPNVIRGNKIQEPVGGDKNPETFDTHAEGAQIDPKLFEAVTQLVAMSNSGVTPFKISNITSLNDNFHNVQKLDSQHRKGRAVDFKLQLPPGQEKPTDKQFQELSSFLKSNLGFDEVTNEYTKKSAGWTGPHIHAHFNDPESTMMGGDNFRAPTDMLQAALGGIASGPKSGYPTMLHGNEIIVPLDPNSILADLGKKSQEQIKTEMSTFEKSMSGDNLDTTVFRDIAKQNQQLMEMIGYKLDNVINKLDTGNDTQDKILKYSQA